MPSLSHTGSSCGSCGGSWPSAPSFSGAFESRCLVGQNRPGALAASSTEVCMLKTLVRAHPSCVTRAWASSMFVMLPRGPSGTSTTSAGSAPSYSQPPAAPAENPAVPAGSEGQQQPDSFAGQIPPSAAALGGGGLMLSHGGKSIAARQSVHRRMYKFWHADIISVSAEEVAGGPGAHFECLLLNMAAVCNESGWAEPFIRA